MTIVSTDNYAINFYHDSELEKVLETDADPEIFNFVKAIDLVKYLADENNDDFIRFQSVIDNQLEADKDARILRKLRNRLGTLRHFPRYRGSQFEQYHLSARRVASGTFTPRDMALVDGLQGEIDASNVKLQPGQVLFHGRSNHELTQQKPYPSFVSTTLNPVVARNSAFRRSGINSANGPPLVYVLTLQLSLPALWGQAGGSAEWELLLPRLLSIEETGRYRGRNFDVVEAEVVKGG